MKLKTTPKNEENVARGKRAKRKGGNYERAWELIYKYNIEHLKK